MITLQPMNIQSAAADLLWSRVLKNYPELRIALSEGGTGWIPYFLDRVDRTFEMHRAWTLQDFGGRLPSEVFREHFLTCFISDPVGVELRDQHRRSTTWRGRPTTRTATRCGRPRPEELDDGVRGQRRARRRRSRKMTHENAMRWYSFDPFAHVPKDEATVGALRRQAAGHDVSIMSRSTRVRTPDEKLEGFRRRARPRSRPGAERGVSNVARQMSLVGFMQAGNTTVYAGSWRHPATEHGFLDAGYYQKLGRTLEEGCFDLMFFDDRLAMPGIYGGSVAEAVRTGARPVKLDLSIVLGVVAGATRHIGLGATYSTTYYSPFHVARTFATLDHLSGGRAAWNVVTSVNDSEAQNFGVDERPRTTTSATTGPTSSSRRRPGCGTRGRTTPSCSTGPAACSPTRTRSTSSTTRASGSRSAARSPCPAAPQGRPVLLQAGSSGRGRDFAAALGRADLHRRPRHRHRPVALQGPEGAHRRGAGATPTR